MIAIVDYGMGNIHSVRKALELMGARTKVTNSPKEIERAHKVVLPGVGSFGDAMKELSRRNLVSALQDAVRQRKYFLGICLGMQLLFERSKESPSVRGLSIIPGSVELFKGSRKRKVPHMGWNQLVIRQRQCPFLRGVADKSDVYFCHSYYPSTRTKSAIAAVTNYGLAFPSIVWQDTVFGVQFHPEKSQETGLRMIKNFVALGAE